MYSVRVDFNTGHVLVRQSWREQVGHSRSTTAVWSVPPPVPDSTGHNVSSHRSADFIHTLPDLHIANGFSSH